MDTDTVPTRVPKPLVEFARGEWLHATFLRHSGVVEVLHVETWGQRATLVYRKSGISEPQSTSRHASEKFFPLTEDEMAAVMDRERRTHIAHQFRRLADLVAQDSIPLPDTSQAIDVEFNYGTNAEAVSALAKVLDVQVARSASSVSALLFGADDRGEGVDIIGRAALAAKHYETGGWKGEGPGTCGVECACGVTYDGFDSLAEAKQQLDWHIADPTGMDRSRSDEDTPPQPVAGRAPAHVGHVETGGQLVDDDVSFDDDDAQHFRFGMHDHLPLHFMVTGRTGCGMSWGALPVGHGTVGSRDHTTCPDCDAAMQPDAALDTAEACWHGEIAPGRDCPGSGPDCGPAI